MLANILWVVEGLLFVVAAWFDSMSLPTAKILLIMAAVLGLVLMLDRYLRTRHLDKPGETAS